jgi:hypothetical protein
VKTLLAAFAFVALVVAVGANADGVRVGVADDWPESHPCGDVFWQSVDDINYSDLRMTVQWDGSGPTAPISDASAAATCAIQHGVRPIVAIYPAKPTLIGSNASAQAAFASFAASVASQLPQVKNFIIGNEPNVNRFWQPQFVGGQSAAPVDYEHTLAQSYDAVKAVRSDAVIWGPAISSRGNDIANAASNPSQSPVWFIKYMGDAYKASGRTKPIFDEFDMHPYPPTQDTDPYSKPFQWPQAGAANLDRIKQALWDAFHGTGQPIPAEQAGGRITLSARFVGGSGLPIDLDEVGSQTDVTGHNGYTDFPESISPITEAQQAQYYTQLMEIAACDPDVKALLFFPLIDESDVHNGFQSGELYVDQTQKQSYAAVKAKIASSHGNCQGGVPGVSQAWVHTEQVVGAQAFWQGPGSQATGQPTNKPGTNQYWAFSVTTGEDAGYTASLVDVKTKKAVRTMTGTAKANYTPLVHFAGGLLPVGCYDYQVVLTAAVNAQRTTTLTSSPFTVGASASCTGAAAATTTTTTTTTAKSTPAKAKATVKPKPKKSKKPKPKKK